MKHLLHTLPLCCLIIGFTSYAHAQQQQQSCPIPPPSPFKHTARLATRFDTEASIMRTVLEHPRAIGDQATPLFLAASFAYTDGGRASVATRTQVEISLVSVASSARFERDHVLRIYTDGREVAPLASARYRAARDERDRVIEEAGIRLPAVALLDMARAAQIEVELAGKRYALTSDHREALRELASLLNPRTPSVPPKPTDGYEAGAAAYSVPRAR